MAKSDAEILKLARARFKQVEDAEGPQRQREIDDLRFYGGDQWPPDVINARRGIQANDGSPAVPARPCETINKLREPVRQVLNQERQMDMGVEIVPADDFGELSQAPPDNEIKLREGLVRRIQRESSARSARTWAYERAVEAGRGYYRVNTRFLPGKTWDQEVVVQRIYNQNSVSMDPAHEEPDGSDADWAFLGTDMPIAAFEAEFGDAEGYGDYDDEEWRQLGEDCKGWFTEVKGTRFVRVVEYFYRSPKSRTVALMENGDAVWEDELPEGVKPKETREEISKAVQWCKITGDRILDKTTWPGPTIPIIKVVGEELQPYDQERRYEGMVRPARSSQFGFNVMVSKQLELVGLAPIPPIMLAEGQDAGFEAEWDASTTRTLGRLHYRQKDLDGNQAPPPFSTPRQAPIAEVSEALQIFHESIKSTTGVPDPTLQNVGPNVKSGKAVALLDARAQLTTSNLLDNLQRSIRYEGQIENDLLYPIYGRPGRMARMIDQNGEAESVKIGTPGQPGPNPAEHYTLTPDARFNVAIKVTRNYDLRREQEADTVGELMKENPALMGVIGDVYFRNQDGPGHEEMEERVKATLDPRVLAAIQAKNGQPQLPPEVQAQMQQMQGALQQMQQELQEAKSGMAVAQLKAQTELAIADKDNQTKMQIASMQTQADLAKTQATLDQKAAEASIEAETKRLAAVLGEKVGVAKELMKQDHETGAQRLDHTHELVQTAVQHAHEQAQAATAAAQMAQAPGQDQA